jgi:hypothetical protein
MKSTKDKETQPQAKPDAEPAGPLDHLPEKVKEKVEQLPQDLQGIAAEFPDWAEVIAGANYDRKGPEIVGGDHAKFRYILAAPNHMKNHPMNVDACTQLGYRVSPPEVKVVNPADDCVLMETLWPLYNARMQREQAASRSKLAAVKRHVEKGGQSRDGEGRVVGADGLEVLDRSAGDGMGPGFRKTPFGG